MTLGDFIQETTQRFRTEPIGHAVSRTKGEFLKGIFRRTHGTVNYGTSVWDRDWDLLIILDGCRMDLFQEITASYDYLSDDPEHMYSVASMSEEWLQYHTQDQFQEDQERTALITANVYSGYDPSYRDGWAYVDEVWKHSWNSEKGTVLPRSVTDAAIRFFRDRPDGGDADRVILWYFQPHRPFVNADWSTGFDIDQLAETETQTSQVDEFKQLRDREVSFDTLWTAYRDNLKYALDDLQTLLRNIDVEQPVITSDHANLVGELGIYGHPRYVPHPTLRRVPWAPVEAEDTGTYEPPQRDRGSTESDDSHQNENVEEKLRALGYI